jgi:hypothetical protein
MNVSQRISRPLVHRPAPVTFNLSQLGDQTWQRNDLILRWCCGGFGDAGKMDQEMSSKSQIQRSRLNGRLSQLFHMLTSIVAMPTLSRARVFCTQGFTKRVDFSAASVGNKPHTFLSTANKLWPEQHAQRPERGQRLGNLPCLGAKRVVRALPRPRDDFGGTEQYH